MVNTQEKQTKNQQMFDSDTDENSGKQNKIREVPNHGIVFSHQKRRSEYYMPDDSRI